jgi:acyl-CoA reductase-like NAD-dependent aldehyde dehydrogenase
LARQLGPIEPLPPNDPLAGLAAFTAEGQGAAIWSMIEQDLQQPGVSHVTAEYGPRLAPRERYAYLLPTVVHCDAADTPIAAKEFMFPFVSVVQCAQEEMLNKIGPTLVATAVTDDESWIKRLTQATQIDRLNIGPIPTQRLNWLQPHEGNLIEFLFRSRALQWAEQPSPVR